MADTNCFPTELHIRLLQDIVSGFISSFLTGQHSLLPPSFGYCRQETAVQIVYLAAITHGAMRSRRLVTKRDVYYMCRALFPNTGTVDRILCILERALGAQRNSLNVVAAPKGIVCGRIHFVDESGAAIDVGAFYTEGVLIPARPERLRCIDVRARAVLVYVTGSFAKSSFVCTQPAIHSRSSAFLFVELTV